MKKSVLHWFIGFITLLNWPACAQAQEKASIHTIDKAGAYIPNQLIVKFKSPVTAKGYRTDDASFRTRYEAFRQLGVRKTHKLHPQSQIADSHKKSFDSRKPKKGAGLDLIYRIELDAKTDVSKAIGLLKNQPDVEYAEPVYQHFPLDFYMPNDPKVNGQYYLSQIKAHEAWLIEKGNPAVTIGVVDYGFIPIHEDLAGNIQYNLDDPVDGIDNDQDGYIDNYAGWNMVNNNNNLYPATGNGVHGTWTGGIAAAVADNGKGIAGTGFNCKFLPVKVEGLLWNGHQNVVHFYGYEGLLYAAQHGSKVINLSWGRPGPYSQYEENIINYVVDILDVVVVAAAGNNNNEVLYWPASYDKVISVAGTDYENVDQKWQSHEPAVGSSYNDKVDICAPSEYIMTTSYANPPDANSTYTYFYDPRSGTSMAAPQVSAAAALVRSKYPALKAAEVKDRLLATADNIDAKNPDYIGKLGRGRLNIYKALADVATIQAVSLEQYTITNQQGQAFILSGDRASIALYLKSMYGTFNNLQVRLTSLTDGVNVTKPEVSYTPFSQGQTVNNLGNAFEIQADASLGANTQANFRLDLRDGSFNYTQYIKIIINPDYLSIANNQVSLTVGNTGRFGFNDDLLGWTQKGTGFTYKGNNLLVEGGFLLGTSPAQVSSSIMNELLQNFNYNNTYIYQAIGKNDHFKATRHFNSFHSPAKDIEIRNVLTDTLKSKNPNPAGVQVAQRNYTWQNDKFIIIEYQITNVTNTEIDTLYAGISANFDVQDFKNNVAKWDAANKMGYMYNQQTQNLYAGVQLLTKQPVHYYIIDHIEGINLLNDFKFTTAKKYTSLSSRIFSGQSTNGALDVQQTLSAQLNHLKPGETRTVAFAFLAGDNLADLQASASGAQAKFTQLKTSPAPVIANVDVCKDNQASILPQNGSNFNLYTSLPLTTPAATGNTFNLGKVTSDSTYYVTSVDSLYESQPTPVQVKAFTHKAAFDIVRDTLGIYEGDTLQLTGTSRDATRWTWYFGDNSTGAGQNPIHQYANPGKYTIKLVSESKLGCKDSLTREVLVVNGKKSLTPAIPDQVICQGESLTLSPANGTNFNLYTGLPLTTPIVSGSSFNLGSLAGDTVVYITCTDFLLESEPVKVTIRVSRHTANFELSNDTLDLRLLQQIQITDKSTGAVQWQWDLGDGHTSTEQNPAHAYALPGEYTIKLISRNTDNCESSYTGKVVVIQTTGLAGGINSLANLFPNPASGKIMILLADSFARSTADIQITSLWGQVVYQGSMQGKQTTLDLSGYAKGQYLVRIKSGDKTVIKKLVLL